MPRTSAKHGCRGGEACLDIAHGDRETGGRAKAARGDGADLAATFVEKVGPGAHRLAAFRLEADALGAGAFGNGVKNGFRAVEGGFSRTALVIAQVRPAETGSVSGVMS